MKAFFKVLLIIFAVFLTVKFVLLLLGLAYKMIAWIIGGVVGILAARRAGSSRQIPSNSAQKSAQAALSFNDVTRMQQGPHDSFMKGLK